jgi:predicted DNA-binding protein with PD1-like motif
MRGPESRTLGPIGTVGRYRLAKELTHCWLANDATKDIITDYDLPAEMSGTGDVVNGRVHIHATMAVEGDRAISGHLHRAQVGTWFARVYLLPDV